MLIVAVRIIVRPINIPGQFLFRDLFFCFACLGEFLARDGRDFKTRAELMDNSCLLRLSGILSSVRPAAC